MGFWDVIFFPVAMAGSFLAMLIGVVAFLFVIWMIIDCAGRKFKNSAEKIIWILVMIFTTWVGALIYFVAVKSMNSHGVLK